MAIMSPFVPPNLKERANIMKNLTSLQKNLADIQAKSPLVHNITNYVVMNNTANALLAIGASPVMAHAVEEVADMVSIASSLVLNMGTLSPQWVEAMLKAGQKAKALKIPIVFDPVGVGATAYRNEVASKILALTSPTVIRANASEIMALAGANIITKGVDSSQQTQNALQSAKNLATQQKCIVVVSGAQDIITDGTRVSYCDRGDALMTKVTGMGCTASAILGAFVAVEQDTLQAAINATALVGSIGQLSAQTAKAPGSLQTAFLDNLYRAATGELNLGSL